MVWSYGYYVLDEQIVGDKKNDEVCEILEKNYDLIKKSPYKKYLTKEILNSQGYRGEKGWPKEIKGIAERLFEYQRDILNEQV
jgi:hypothetical protein